MPRTPLPVAVRIGSRRRLYIRNEALEKGASERRRCSEDRGVISEGRRHSFKSRRLNLNGNVSAVVIYYPRDILWSRTGHVEGPAPREDPLPRVLPTEGQTEGFDGKVDHWGGR